MIHAQRPRLCSNQSINKSINLPDCSAIASHPGQSQCKNADVNSESWRNSFIGLMPRASCLVLRALAAANNRQEAAVFFSSPSPLANSVIIMAKSAVDKVCLFLQFFQCRFHASDRCLWARKLAVQACVLLNMQHRSQNRLRWRVRCDAMPGVRKNLMQAPPKKIRPLGSKTWRAHLF